MAASLLEYHCRFRFFQQSGNLFAADCLYMFNKVIRRDALRFE
jgi:hypothetical protein